MQCVCYVFCWGRQAPIVCVLSQPVTRISSETIGSLTMKFYVHDTMHVGTVPPEYEHQGHVVTVHPAEPPIPSIVSYCSLLAWIPVNKATFLHRDVVVTSLVQCGL